MHKYEPHTAWHWHSWYRIPDQEHIDMYIYLFWRKVDQFTGFQHISLKWLPILLCANHSAQTQTKHLYFFFFTENKKHPNKNKLTLLYGFDSFENRIYFTFIARSFFAIHFAWNGLGHVQHWNTPAKIRKNYCFCLRAQAWTLGLISKYVCVCFF